MTSTKLLRSRVKVTFHARFCRPVGWVTALLSLTPKLLKPQIAVDCLVVRAGVEYKTQCLVPVQTVRLNYRHVFR